MTRLVSIVFAMITLGAHAQSGPFAPAGADPGSEAIHYSSGRIIAWANSCSVTQGYLDVASPSMGYVTAGDSTFAIGQADGQTVSLGDAGEAVYQLDFPLENIDGPDFAVFENGFKVGENEYFLELAHVEVSSNGVDFIRFPSQSLTNNNQQVQSYETMDPTYIDGLAGKQPTGYGEPFDLDELADTNVLNKDSVLFIRIVDVIGTINASYGSFDGTGNIINDPYPTDFASGGFDLDALAILGEYNGLEEAQANSVRIFPNPCKTYVQIEVDSQSNYRILDLRGNEMPTSNGTNRLDVSDWPRGVYFIIQDGFSTKLLVE